MKTKLLLFFLFVCCGIVQAEENKTVMVAILARNKAHFLPKYLSYIEKLDYPKNLMTLYINTNNNEDETKEILESWLKIHQSHYAKVIFESHDVQNLVSTMPHEWTKERFKVLGAIRNKSLQLAKEYQCDYYFVVDCDNFIRPCTLKELIRTDKPIVAPLLKALPEPGDCYSNYFCDVGENGYYKDHPSYMQILTHQLIGTFKVPVVHCTYLIKKECIDSLTYVDGTDDYEFVIFSRCARNKGIEQYICNFHEFGILYHAFDENLSLNAEKQKAQSMLTYLDSF